MKHDNETTNGWMDERLHGRLAMTFYRLVLHRDDKLFIAGWLVKAGQDMTMRFKKQDDVVWN